MDSLSTVSRSVTNIARRIIREPLKVTGFVLALLGMGSAFGWWNLTPEQSDGILVFIGAFIVLISLFVTPTKTPALREGTMVTLPDGEQGTVIRGRTDA